MPHYREKQNLKSIIKQAFDEVCDNIEKTISEME